MVPFSHIWLLVLLLNNFCSNNNLEAHFWYVSMHGTYALFIRCYVYLYYHQFMRHKSNYEHISRNVSPEPCTKFNGLILFTESSHADNIAIGCKSFLHSFKLKTNAEGAGPMELAAYIDHIHLIMKHCQKKKKMVVWKRKKWRSDCCFDREGLPSHLASHYSEMIYES